MVIGGVAYLSLSQKNRVNDLEKKQAPYKPNPDKPTNPDISAGGKSEPTDNNLPPPVDIHELPPEEPIKPDNPIDISPDLSPPKPHESEEEIKKECIKSMGEEI
nr:11830_t:CDS:1 [Entrophospora candida]